ncbi:MAG: YkgJ family cysteine cluster protein [Bacteroidia bacterium]
MLPDSYNKLLLYAQKHFKENKKFLDKLKQQKPKDLDIMINQLHDEAFENIDCLQCANCCKTTGPLLLGKDIDRLADAEKLRPADFTQKYIKTDEDGDYVFKSMPCPFLNNDNYCRVYSSRPNACRQYPHTQQNNQLQKLSITIKNSLICPAVAKVVQELKNVYVK